MLVVIAAGISIANCCSTPAPLADDAVKAKLAAMRGNGRQQRRSPVRSARRSVNPSPLPAAAAAVEPVVLPGSESAAVPVWDVPERLRMPGSLPCTSHGRHASLDEVFPGSGLGEAWATNAELRTALRQALRADLFFPPSTWNDEQRAAATGLDAACMVTWRVVAAPDGPTCDGFSVAFAAHGVALSGREFVCGLGALCGERPHGSLIDIVPLQRRVQHSWHQDSGISSDTVSVADGC